MSQTLLATNDFHGTTTNVTVDEVHGMHNGFGAPIARVKMSELAKAQRELCGYAECVCTGPHALTDEAGRVYGVLGMED